MAQEQNNQPRTFDKALNEDVKDFHLPSNEWTQARNAINNSKTGDLGRLGNEPGNTSCISTDFTIIGFIHIIEDKWAVFSTDNTTSEIGLFIESNCGDTNPDFKPYYTIVNDSSNPCLNFNTAFLIKGASRSTSTCTYKLYWDDGLNPTRVLEIDVDNPSRNEYTDPNSTIPWIQNCQIIDSCNICVNTPDLNCDKIRLAPFMLPICPRVENGISGGNLLNGSYMVVMAYSVKGQKISDWYISNIQPIFSHLNSSGSLDVYIDSIDLDYDEIQVGIVSVVNQQAVVKLAGTYSTRQTRLSFDSIFNDWPTIPLEQVPIMTPIADKTDATYNVGEYLIRVGPTSKEDFNYQPLANQIVTKWQSIEYPSDYYVQSNNNVGYMRDEVYAFFIQWIYDTGDRSAAYHIPGRPPFENVPVTGSHPSVTSDLDPAGGANAILGDNEQWEVYNTAIQTATPGTALPDGGIVRAEGLMGYWESTEQYPDNKPEVWDAGITLSPYQSYFNVIPTGTPLTTGAQHNLCGKKIRHHKFPEDNLTAETNRYNAGTGNKIRVMGVLFENIKTPRLRDGNLVPGIVGYRILRGTRNGNRTILAKGIINNMHDYELPGISASTKRGVYPNYPYNDLRDDPFLSTKPTETSSTFNTSSTGGQVITEGESTYNSAMPGGFTGFPAFSKNYLTFHSPDTNFNNPFLANKEMRIYQNVYGNVTGKFEISEKHPKEKLITDYVFLIAAIAGAAVAALNMNGERRVIKTLPGWQGYSYRETYVPGSSAQDGIGQTITVNPTSLITLLPNSPTVTVNSPPISSPLVSSPDPAVLALLPGALGLISTASTVYDAAINLTSIAGAVVPPGTGGTVPDAARDANATASDAAATSTLGAMSYTTTTIDQKDGQLQRIPGFLNALLSAPSFLNYFTDGTDSFIRLIKAIIRYRDYAVRYHSQGFYNNAAIRPDTFRSETPNTQYIDPELVDFDPVIRINNLYRCRTVAVRTTALFDPPGYYPGSIADKTRFTGDDLSVGTNGFFPSNDEKTIETLVSKEITGSVWANPDGAQVCSSHYVALKVRIRNQYGQLNRIVQIPTAHCYTTFVSNPINGNVLQGGTTPVIFGGDTYVNRYTEKNTFLFFNDWLYGQPDGAQLNYNEHRMVAYPKYWANFNQFQTNDFTTSFFGFILTPGSWGSGDIITPRDYYALDGTVNGSWFTNVSQNFRADKRGWFYLFNSGVRDFFVESEINLAFRDYGELAREKFYNPYLGGSTKDLFNTDIIKSGNYYKYDISLSTSKLPINYTSWANTQEPTYNPYDAATCFVYQPTRVIYSLPAQYEGLKDGWRVFLPNNYYDFNNVVTCIKSVNKSGAMIFFDAASPVQFQGLDQLQTDLGTKLTIGDGGLFSQPMQQIINVDASHEYASCQNRLSVINTPAGLYWISQNQGKIFSMSGGLKEVSNVNMKWWFAQYLPYQLTLQFPDFTLIDNPVIGIGCQSVYDNENGILYFSKRDFYLKSAYTPDQFEYIPDTDKFVYLPLQLTITLGDPLYFNDASWTVSYDPKTDGWISYHDWHPSLTLPGKNTFMSVSPYGIKNSIWIHNERCDLYCNYYGIDFPFEVEFTVSTGQTVNTLRSIEYIMEAYKYAPNCYDRFHVLDYNFDEAVIYNTEQVSGLLRLNLNPKENPNLILQYPIINPTNIDILFSKEENKYRFNQFWDITDDRGEYNPIAQRPIWDTAPNGYVRVLNPNNLNYNKAPLQRKKFRHYTTSVLLRKRVVAGQSMNYKMLVMIADTKNLYSPR